MKRKIISILTLFLVSIFVTPLTMRAEGEVNLKEIIFHHLGDGYGWEVPFSHTQRIPLPVIVVSESGSWYCFSSANLSKVEMVVENGNEEEHVKHPIYTAKDGTKFMIAPATSANKNKVVQLVERDKSQVENTQCIDIDGVSYREYKPLDLSITKNVLALFISVIVVIFMVMSVARWYKNHGMTAPRKARGFVELVIEYVYTGVIKATLGDKTKKFAPYLLTAFFFILTMNLLGLIVIFPGGANLTGNIAVTMVMAILTFVLTNVLGTKHYWKEIFWPDVPIWLKCPLPIMQMIEVFGIFTKPAALCVRLFANMMGGHMIVITLTSLIFIFAAYGVGVAGGTSVVSLMFTIFMLTLDVLVSFIQAYVFTMLSTMFISAAQESGHSHKELPE